MNRLYHTALARKNHDRPPVWFMRQAGRYHRHYQNLRAKYGFVDLCKVPELACETTLGPIRDFDFDAAILFSDILFPLESMGMGLTYDPAPKLSFQLRTNEDIERLSTGADIGRDLSFQEDALKLIRAKLDDKKGLIGFVGSPFTLYVFAVEGTHRFGCPDAANGLRDGRYRNFIDKLQPVLLQAMVQQARAGVDALALFDTCAGDISSQDYMHFIVPVLADLLKAFKSDFPDVPVLYYAKNATPLYWKHIEHLPIDALGIDWNQDLVSALEVYGDRWSIQGNFDPHLLRDNPKVELINNLAIYFAKIKKLNAQKRSGWVCGLGHGVLPQTPEENVQAFITLQREFFG